jgi:simple sugar transport system ATP-binding protein
VDPDARITDLTVGAQQRVEIVKALSRDARVLILDEPTAVLTPDEARELLHRTREFAERGGTAILITHKLREALEFADDVTVLRRGETVWTGAARDATEATLVQAMLGDEQFAERTTPVTSRGLGAPVLTLRGVTVRDEHGVERLRDATFVAHGGEIVGVAAVEGNGQSELLRVLAGRLEPTAGTVERPAVVGFIPEDRRRDALIAAFTLTENVALLGAGARHGVERWREHREATEHIIAEYDVRASGPDARAGGLSGGNQQKLVAGRELERASQAVVAENPSRGLDVQASAAIFARLREARDNGMAVVMYSSDLDEVLDIADRIVVAHAGRLTEVPRDRGAIGRAMLGAV